MDLNDLTRDLDSLREDALERSPLPLTSRARGDRARRAWRRGRADRVLRGIGGLPADDRPRIGAIANEVRAGSRPRSRSAGRCSADRHSSSRLRAEAIDVTTPGRPLRRGALHPYRDDRRDRGGRSASSGSSSTRARRSKTTSRTSRCSTFRRPPRPGSLGHALRRCRGHLLRTHTSPGQIRVMHQEKPPIRACSPDAATATRRSTPATPRSSSRSRA